MLTNELFEKSLKDAGYSVTKPRVTVFNALEGHEPQSMAEIVQALHQIIDRATVYRTVEIFEKLGIVTRLNLGWKYKIELSENFSHHHHHLSCTRCGKVITFDEGQLLHQAIEHIAISKGFTMHDHSLEIRGLCPTCQTKRPRERTQGRWKPHTSTLRIT